MSWDVMIHRFDGPPPRVEDIADDHEFLPLGEAPNVRRRISDALPAVDWGDPAWGVLEGDGFSIEFNFQAHGPVTGFMLHVRGGGDPITPIVAMCKLNGWAALDTSSGEFLDLAKPSVDGWESFQGFRDQIIGGIEGQSRDRAPWWRRLISWLRGGDRSVQ